MINTTMRPYYFFTLGAKDEYGQLKTPDYTQPEGTIKMSIHITSQSIQDNIRYQDASYVGLTHANVNDTYIIDFKGEKLKVLYVNDLGRLKQVFLKNI